MFPSPLLWFFMFFLLLNFSISPFCAFPIVHRIAYTFKKRNTVRSIWWAERAAFDKWQAFCSRTSTSTTQSEKTLKLFLLNKIHVDWKFIRKIFSIIFLIDFCHLLFCSFLFHNLCVLDFVEILSSIFFWW